jgi:hypothetical protein
VTSSHVSHDLPQQAATWAMICHNQSRESCHGKQLCESSRQSRMSSLIVTSSHVSHDMPQQAVTWVMICHNKQPRESWSVTSSHASHVMTSSYVSSHVSHVCHCLSWQVVTWVMQRKLMLIWQFFLCTRTTKYVSSYLGGRTLDNNMKIVNKRIATERRGMDWSGRR